MAPQFCKISFIVIIFCHFLGQRQFAMGFNEFFGLFCQVLGAFWWVPIMVLTENKYTYICEEQGDRASNKVFCVWKLNCKSLLNAFGLKNCQCFLRRWQWKRKEILRMLLGQIIDIWSNGHGRTRKFHELDNWCNFLLRWLTQIKRSIRFLWFGHPGRKCKHFHAIYTFQCVRKVGSVLNGAERWKQRCRIWKLFWRSPKSFYLFHHLCQQQR